MARLKPLWLHLNSISERMQTISSVAVACDYDGTLTPIVDHPSQAILPERAQRILKALSLLPDTRLAVLSGRSLDDLERCVPLPGVFLSGVSGIEIRDETGRREICMNPDDELPPRLKAELQEWCARFPGSWIEDKRFSYSLHYRAVTPAQQPAFGAGVRRRVHEHPGRAALIHGKRVFEVMPAVARDKSFAIERWLGLLPENSVSFYFGDDSNDEPAHERVRRYGGIAVAVGRPVSRAEYVVTSTSDVIWFLEWLEREWSVRHHSSPVASL